ncbi:MAG TPA: hypothetical protein VFN87_18360 [Solirubrobacteraceae bacterium]|nr:hypothetical protein [Solirubrobacteraceae bacterium]
MSRFVVDSRSLLAVRDALGHLHDRLLGMHTVIWASWGTLGGRELAGELEHFCGTWHYGVREITDEIARLMNRLTEAAAAYERIERRVATAGHTHGGPVGPRTGSGSGSGTTVIGGPPADRGGGSGGSGSGSTVIGGPHTHREGGSGGSGSASGSGSTVIGGPPSHSSGSGTIVIDDAPREPAPAPAAAMTFGQS